MNEQDFYESTQKQQLEYIINLMCMGDSSEFEELKCFYECTYNVSFDFECLRYDYSFLTALSLYEAIKLYDNLKETVKEAFIAIIELDHGHLLDLVNIHKTLNTFSTVQSLLKS